MNAARITLVMSVVDEALLGALVNILGDPRYADGYWVWEWDHAPENKTADSEETRGKNTSLLDPWTWEKTH